MPRHEENPYTLSGYRSSPTRSGNISISSDAAPLRRVTRSITANEEKVYETFKDHDVQDEEEEEKKNEAAANPLHSVPYDRTENRTPLQEKGISEDAVNNALDLFDQIAQKYAEESKEVMAEHQREIQELEHNIQRSQEEETSGAFEKEEEEEKEENGACDKCLRVCTWISTGVALVTIFLYALEADMMGASGKATLSEWFGHMMS
jgi:hypothetical protein